MLRLGLLAVLLVCLPIQPVKAEVQPEVRTLAQFQLVTDEFQNPQKRMELINALKAYCLALDKAYPKNSPKEDEWLSGEIKSKDYNRLIRAIGSSESGRQMADNFTSTCIDFTTLYIQKPAQRAAAIFVLIEAITKFAPDAPHQARKNGLNEDQWGFMMLNSLIGTLSRAGVAETGNAFYTVYP